MQTGGTATVGGTLYVASGPGITGLYDLGRGGGSLSVTGPVVAGGRGTATVRVGPGASVSAAGLALAQLPTAAVADGVTQTGGTVTLGPAGLTAGPYAAAAGANATAAYVLAGGTLATPAVAGAARNPVPFTFAFNGGTLAAGASTATFMQGLSAATVGVGGATVDTRGFDVTVVQPLLHDSSLAGAADGGLTKAGPGTLTLAGAAAYSGPTAVSAGTLALAAGAAGTAPAVRTLAGGLTVAAGATLALAPAATPAGRTVLVTSTLAVAGTVDLSDGDLDVSRGSLAAVTALAAAGYAGGTWAGTGLASSAAAADATHLTAVGVIQDVGADGSTPLYTTFDGQPVAATDVLARYTVYGDANLDGVVNAADYLRIDAGYVNHLTGWQNGDFNYDGVVDGSDYTLMDNAFNQQIGSVGSPAAMAATSTAETAGGGTAAVPEPASLGLLAMAGASRLGRRRRRR